MLPLVQRTPRALTLWLTPAYASDLRFEPDLDKIEALAPERDALWKRIGAAEFLSDSEKRIAVGWKEETSASRGDIVGTYSRKYRPDQARDDRGRWEDEGRGNDEDGPAIDAIDGQTVKPSQAPPMTLAQATGGNALIDLGVRSITSRDITLTAPPGSTVSRFTVPPLANPIQSPLSNIPIAGA